MTDTTASNPIGEFTAQIAGIIWKNSTSHGGIVEANSIAVEVVEVINAQVARELEAIRTEVGAHLKDHPTNAGKAALEDARNLLGDRILELRGLA